MRQNLPVTQREIDYDPSLVIVSRTDEKGRITYANPAFCEIAGFTESELIGQAHNIVRHPDMPPSAFGDLWNTIKAGYPWRGLVKNRARNGDHYWVEAFATPIKEDGRVVGYQSVRSKPSRDQVAAAEALYKQVNAGQASLSGTRLSRPVHEHPAFTLAVGIGLLASIIAPGFLPQYSSAFAMLGTVLLMVAAGSLYFGFIEPIERAKKAVAAMIEGRLQEPVRYKRVTELDSLLVNLEALRINYRAIFTDVLHTSRSLESHAHHLDHEIQSLETAAHQQSGKVMEVASSMQEMSVAINEISARTDGSLRLSTEAKSVVQSSGERMKCSLERINAVVGTVNTSRSELERLHATVQQIGTVTDVIKGIADQTNLLALNAAIEAARAGEQGRGFGVVADEVRRLAERTGESTLEITSRVQAIRQVTQEVVQVMQRAVEEVQSTDAYISTNADSLQQIDASSDQIVQSAQEVAVMLQQQSGASHDVANAVEVIAGEIEHSGQSVSRVARTSADVKLIASSLRQLVATLEKALVARTA